MSFSLGVTFTVSMDPVSVLRIRFSSVPGRISRAVSGCVRWSRVFMSSMDTGFRVRAILTGQYCSFNSMIVE